MEEQHGSVTISKANQAPAGGGEADPWAGFFKARKEPAMKQPEIEMEALKTQMGPTGGMLRKGSAYTLHSEAQAAEHVRLGLGVRKSPEAPTEQEEAAGTEADELSKPWPLTLTPEAYLDKYGDDAKHSAHAKAVIERESKA